MVRLTVAVPGVPKRLPRRPGTFSLSASASGPSGPGFSGVWHGTRKLTPLVVRSS